MQKPGTAMAIAAAAAITLAACSGSKNGSSSTTTTNASSAPAPSMAAAAAPAMASGATKTSMTGATAPGPKIFTMNCASCHQANGKGQPGAFPPLAGNAVVTGPATKTIHIVKDGLNGKIAVAGKTYNAQMPAWKGTLSDSDIASVVTYIRSAWGNRAGAVTVSQVTAIK